MGCVNAADGCSSWLTAPFSCDFALFHTSYLMHFIVYAVLGVSLPAWLSIHAHANASSLAFLSIFLPHIHTHSLSC